MAINKLPEFAKDGQKNTDDLVLTDGFPVLKKPARQWFNWLFNTLTVKINEIIDADFIPKGDIVDNLTTDDPSKPVSAKQAKNLQDNKLNKSSNLSDLANVGTARTNLGLGNAALGTLTSARNDTTIGRVLRVGDFGLGLTNESVQGHDSLQYSNLPVGAGQVLATASGVPNQNGSTTFFTMISGPYGWRFGHPNSDNHIYAQSCNNGTWRAWGKIYTTQNTTVDSNGFVKAASPILNLFSDRIELNEEAQLQPIEFEKLGVGNYLLKGSTGFALEGWYVEQPKDANGNVFHAVVYEQLENGDISVKTFEQKLDGTRIVADLEKPVDIKESRFISIRLNELPEDVTAPQNPNVIDNEGNPAPSKYHYLENGTWKITAEDEVTLENERYAAYQASLRPLTRRQFKLALLKNGLLDQIENSISAIEDSNMRARIQIEYTEATEFHRTSDSVAYMCQLLSLTDEQVDQMWESALTL